MRLWCAGHNYFMNQLTAVTGVFGEKVSKTCDGLSHQYIVYGSNGWHNRCSNMIFCLCVHLSVENYLKALYLPWQRRGLGCGSRWKQACAATKDIVIMKAFEGPLASNGPHSGRGKQRPLESTPSWEYVRGVHLELHDFTSQTVTLNATQCE